MARQRHQPHPHALPSVTHTRVGRGASRRVPRAGQHETLEDAGPLRAIHGCCALLCCAVRPALAANCPQAWMDRCEHLTYPGTHTGSRPAVVTQVLVLRVSSCNGLGTDVDSTRPLAALGDRRGGAQAAGTQWTSRPLRLGADCPTPPFQRSPACSGAVGAAGILLPPSDSGITTTILVGGTRMHDGLGCMDRCDSGRKKKGRMLAGFALTCEYLHQVPNLS